MTTPVYEEDYQRKPVTLLKDAHIEAISLVDKGANGHRFILFKRASHYVDDLGNINVEGPDTVGVEKYTPLIKGGPSGDEWKVAYSVVAVPNEIDIQKDVWTEDEIRKAAHDFLRKNKTLINFMHKDMNRVGDLVESAVALNKIDLPGGTIPKGAWYIGVEPYPEIKKSIEAGTITGVSVQGSSKRFVADEKQAHVDFTPVEKDANARPVMENPDEAAPPEAKTEDPNEFNYRHIPLGADGPGIKKLQGILNMPATGVYDEATEEEFMQHLEKVHPDAEAEPTIENLKMCLASHADGAATQDGAPDAAGAQAPGAAPDAASAAPTPPVPGAVSQATTQTPMGAPDVPKRLVAKDGDNGAYPLTEGYDPAAGVSGAYNVPALEQVGSQRGNEGLTNLTHDSSDEDLRIAIYQSFKQNGADLTTYLNDKYHVNSAEQILYQPFSHESLWYMYSRFVHGPAVPQPSDPSLGDQQDMGKAVVTSQPSFTPKKALPNGAGMPMSKSSVPNPDNMTASEKYAYLYGHADKKNCALCKSMGAMCPIHKCLVQKGAMFDHPAHPVSGFVDKNGNDTRVTDYVKCPGGQIGKVSSVEYEEGNPVSVKVYWVDKSNKEVVKDYKPSELENPQPTQVSKGVLPASSGGSMGGHDPRAEGKIRFIVRSFGKWAGGKQSICVDRMRSEHPEVFKGNEDAGCAWLKDQWMGDTHWRNGGEHGVGKMAKGMSAFAHYYNSIIAKDDPQVDPNAPAPDDSFAPSPEDVHGVFVVVCGDMGLDHEAVTNKMDDPAAFEDLLHELFGTEQEANMNDSADTGLNDQQAGLVAKFVDFLKGNKPEPVAKAAPVVEREELTKSQFDTAMNALSLGLSDAMSVDDEAERLANIGHVMSDFANWAGDSLTKSVMVANETLEKGWLPAGTSQGDLEDGDFAWVSSDSSLPESDRRKLPYKVHGVVNEAGWKAARSRAAQTDLTGGPSLEDVNAKLLRDKPEGVDTMEKGLPPALQAYIDAKKKGQVPAEAVTKAAREEIAKGQLPPALQANVDAMKAGKRPGKKKKVDAAEEVAEPNNTPMEENMEKSAVEETRERLIAEAGTFLSELVESSDEATELEKEAPVEEAAADSGLTLDEVALFADRMADRLDAFEAKFGDLHKSLGDKLDTVGELAKSLDLSDRIIALEEAVQAVKAQSAPAESVEEVAKRVQAIEQQPGHATHVDDDGVRQAVAKAAPAPLFTRPGGYSVF